MRIQWDDGKKRTSFSGLFLSSFFSTLPSHLSLLFLSNSSSRSLGLLSFFARALRLFFAFFFFFFILAIVSLFFMDYAISRIFPFSGFPGSSKTPHVSSSSKSSSAL